MINHVCEPDLATLILSWAGALVVGPLAGLALGTIVGRGLLWMRDAAGRR